MSAGSTASGSFETTISPQPYAFVYLDSDNAELTQRHVALGLWCVPCHLQALNAHASHSDAAGGHIYQLGSPWRTLHSDLYGPITLSAPTATEMPRSCRYILNILSLRSRSFQVLRSVCSRKTHFQAPYDRSDRHSSPVYSLFIAECLQTLFLSIATFAAFVPSYSSMYNRDADILFDAVVPLLAALIAAVVQIFYAWRIWIISSHGLKYLILAGVISAVRLVLVFQPQSELTVIPCFSSQ